jgi:hypothetical protein
VRISDSGALLYLWVSDILCEAITAVSSGAETTETPLSGKITNKKDSVSQCLGGSLLPGLFRC